MILGTIILLGIVYGFVQAAFPSLGLPDVSRKNKVKVKVRGNTPVTVQINQPQSPAYTAPPQRTPKGYQGRHSKR